MTTETLNISYVRKNPKRVIEEKVKTRQAFLQFRDSLEKNIHQNNIKNVYLLKDKGLSIKNSFELNNSTQILSFLSELSPIANKMNIIATIIKKSQKLSSRFSVQDIQKLFMRSNLLETAFIESMPTEVMRKKHSKYKLLIKSLLERKS